MEGLRHRAHHRRPRRSQGQVAHHQGQHGRQPADLLGPAPGLQPLALPLPGRGRRRAGRGRVGQTAPDTGMGIVTRASEPRLPITKREAFAYPNFKPAFPRAPENDTKYT